MRIITPSEFFAAANVQPATFRTMCKRGETALAFGAPHALAGGHFLDLDAAIFRIAHDLSAAFGTKMAAGLVRTFSDVVAVAVSRADLEVPEPVWLFAIEFGHRPPGVTAKRHCYGHIKLAAATLPEVFGKSAAGEPDIPARITMVNVSRVLADLRDAARHAGFDLSAPFLPPLDDPEFVEARAEAKQSREQMLAAVRRRAEARAS